MKVFATIALTYFCCHTVLAAEYSLDSLYTLVARYNDNYQLFANSSSSLSELSGADFSTQWDLARSTGVSNLSADLQLDAGSYNLDAFNTFDQRANIDYRRSTERGQWNVGLGYNHDSTRVVEGTIEGGGFFGESDHRVEIYDASAGWFSQLTERHSFNWSLFGNLRRNESDRLTDNEQFGTNVLWQYTVNDRLRLQSRLGYSVFKSEDDFFDRSPLIFNEDDAGTADRLGVPESLIPLFRAFCATPTVRTLPSPNEGFECSKKSTLDNEQATINAQLGVYYFFTERLTLDLLVGRSRVDTESIQSFSDRDIVNATDPDIADQITNRDSSNARFDVELAYDSENFKYTLSASSSDIAGSSGFLTQNTRAALDIDWRLSHRAKVFLQGSWFEQESSDGNVTFLGREQQRARLRYSYRLSEAWTAATEYRYIDQKRLSDTRHTNSNELLLSLSWSPTTSKRSF